MPSFVTKDNPHYQGMTFEGLKNALGGKGAGLMQMAWDGLSVPPFLIYSTGHWETYNQTPIAAMANIAKDLPAIREFFTAQMGYMPLLSVRSGARVSCPGMMDTILNVGMDEKTMPFWSKKLGATCAEDSFHRLLTMYGSVVNGIDRHKLEAGTSHEAFLAWSDLTGFEQWLSTEEQIIGAIEAVFKSWNNERAKTYRKLNNIPDEWGTAVTLQAMVFGNLNDKSGTGVLFTRNPDTGENAVTGEFLINAQGEDVVAGIRTPMPLTKMLEWMPDVANELLTTVEGLEVNRADVQDVEFTIQDGKLYILQTRNAKRSAKAAVKIALDMFEEKILTKEEMISRVSVRELDLADQPSLDPKFNKPADHTGLSGCPGVVSGRPVFSSDAAVAASEKGEAVILVTKETTPDDIAGMVAAQGVVTMEGGSTSHAAVVARAMNKPCITGVGNEHMAAFKKAKVVGMDSGKGHIWFEKLPTIPGNSKDVEVFRNFVVNTGSVIVTEPPKHHAERLTLDLGASLHLGFPHMVELITECAKQATFLTVMVPDYEKGRYPGVDVWMSPKQCEERTKNIREFIDTQKHDLPKELLVLGWKSKTHLAIDCVAADNLEQLILVKKGGMLVGDVPSTPAAKKVMEWLQKEGITLAKFNEKGGIAAWTVHAGG